MADYCSSFFNLKCGGYFILEDELMLKQKGLHLENWDSMNQPRLDSHINYVLCGEVCMYESAYV